MADVSLGFSPSSGWGERSSTRSEGGGRERLTLLSDLAHIVPWEMEDPERGVTWHAPVESLFGAQPEHGAYWVPATPEDGSGRAVRAVSVVELGDVLLAPIVECVRGGIPWENYEIVQEVVAPDGVTHQLLVRAVAVPDADGGCFGIVAEVTEGDDMSWVTADVAERLQLLVEHSPDGILVHHDGITVYGNPAAARMAGLESVDAGIGRNLLDFVHPRDVDGIIERLANLNEIGSVAKGQEVTIIRPDGSELPVEVASVRTTWGSKPAYQVILHDVSERRAAEQAAQARLALERRYAAAVAVLEEGVVVLDREGGVRAANDSAANILGHRLASGSGDAIFTGGRIALKADGSVLRPQDLPIAVALGRGEAQTNIVLGVTDSHGDEQWLSVSCRPLGGSHEEDDAAVVCSVSDMTERKRLLDRLAWEARNDPLTGLANRSGFLAAVADVVAESTSRRGLVVFFVDLDRFKFVNDSLGHAAGDEVLLTMAGRLSAVLSPSAVLSRLHGDEFALLDHGLFDAESVLQRAEEIRTAVARPMRLSTGRTLTVTASIGVVPFDDAGRDASGLLQDADLAMLQAKGAGRGRVALFDAGMRDELGSRLELEDDLRHAIAHDALRLEYQPVASLSSGRVLGIEALVRWDHPERGPIPPLRFVGLAEESDLIVSLGQWVLVEGCVQMARWRAEHPDAMHTFLAVNVSPRQLDGDSLLPALQSALDESGLPPSALVLEITESGFISNETSDQGILDELRSFGVRLAIDDFGTGYSSLSYLKRLPVSYLKVDRSFVMGLGTEREDERIVKAINELGHGLGLRVIAEGVETRQQCHTARAIGCDFYQGYLLARPTRPVDVPYFWRPGAQDPNL